MPLINEAVRRDQGRQRGLHQGVDAAHRASQQSAGGGDGDQVTDLAEALDEMLFASGKLNVKLLGGRAKTAQATVQGVKGDHRGDD